MDPWTGLIQDPLPADIPWERSRQHHARLQQKQSGPDPRGAPRDGVALGAGRLSCGTGGRRMHVSSRRIPQPDDQGLRHFVEATEPTCPGGHAAVLERGVAHQGLRALEPAAFAVRVQARPDVARERGRLVPPWQQPGPRARDELDLAARRDQAVDPANRWVAATLEPRWEEALRHARPLQAAYARGLPETPPP